MLRSCDVCGVSYEAKRTRSKYCTVTCRTRATRARAAASIDVEAECSPGTPGQGAAGQSGWETFPVTDAPRADRSSERPARDRSVADATAAELDAVGRLESALGRAAVALAVKIDEARDMGPGMASLAREWRATLAAATQGAQAQVSSVDELRSRRESRAS